MGLSHHQVAVEEGVQQQSPPWVWHQCTKYDQSAIVVMVDSEFAPAWFPEMMAKNIEKAMTMHLKSMARKVRRKVHLS